MDDSGLKYLMVEELDSQQVGEAPEDETDGGSHVYLVWQDRTNDFKVGRTTNPIKHLRNLQTGNPKPLLMFFKPVSNMVAAERDLKAAMKQFCKGDLGGGTEWFKAKPGDKTKVEEEFMRIAKKYH